jgi:hypothetical protein
MSLKMTRILGVAWIIAGTAAVFWWGLVGSATRRDLRERGLTLKAAVRMRFSTGSIVALVAAFVGAVVLIVLAATTPMSR